MTEHPTPEPFRLRTNWDQTPEMNEAWTAYDAIARALPQCEHNVAWEKERLAARAVYLKTMRARDKLWNQQVKDDKAKAEAEEKPGEQEEDPAAQPPAPPRRARQARRPAGIPGGEHPDPG